MNEFLEQHVYKPTGQIFWAGQIQHISFCKDTQTYSLSIGTGKEQYQFICCQPWFDGQLPRVGDYLVRRAVGEVNEITVRPNIFNELYESVYAKFH